MDGYKDIGSSMSGGIEVSSKEKYYPSVCINMSDLPELSGLEVGEDLKISFVACLKSISIDEDRKEARLELKQAAVLEAGVKAKKEEPKEVIVKNDADMTLQILVEKTGKYA